MTATVPMSLPECRGLLEGGHLGRVAMATPVGPRIVAVNYRVHGDAIVFRTAPYSELTSYVWDSALAFEVDDYDRDTQAAWSVVALGRAHLMDDPADVVGARREPVSWPWARASRHLFVELPWRELTGVRWDDDWAPGAAATRRGA
jgi:nitroimidazol reductase NimA-like FMN-containing flavoprotein (pyridoxamine 5'-phosphate oxidase superfamily)